MRKRVVASTAPAMEPVTIIATQPRTRLDWALWWAAKGMLVFPCESFLGTPLEPKWYGVATSERPAIVSWWTGSPSADIAAVPERTGHYVLVAHGQRGRASLFELEGEYDAFDPAFTYT